MKVNITINNNLMNKVDNLAKCNYMSRSAFISAVLNERVKRENILNTVKMLKDLLVKIEEKNGGDEEIKKEIDRFVGFVDLLEL